MPVNSSLLQKFLFFSLYIFFIFEFFFSPIRYSFSLVGLEGASYLAKLIMLLAIFLCILDFLYKSVARVELLFLFLISYLLLIAFFYTGIFPAVFTIFTLTPLFFGMAVGKIFIRKLNEAYFFKFVLTLLAIAFLGCFIDVFLDYPWSSFTYKVGDSVIEGNRKWSSGGFERVSGFFRLSLIASTTVTFFSILLYFKVNALFYRLFFLLVPCFISAITLSKSIFVFNVIFIIYVCFLWVNIKLRFYTVLLLGLLFFLFTVTMIGYQIDLESPIEVTLLGSFAERLIFTWPEVINMLEGKGGFLLGGGLGAVGPGSKFIGGDSYVVGDSLYLYLLGSGGGILCFMLLIWFIYLGFSLKKGSYVSEVKVALLFYLLVTGIGMSVLDYPILSFAFGLLLNRKVSGEPRAIT